MIPKTRSIFIKAIIIGASICLGAFIAFKFFRTGVQEIVDAQEIVESASPSMSTDEEFQKMDAEVEAFRAKMTQEEREDFDKQVEELMVNIPPDGSEQIDGPIIMGRNYEYLRLPSVDSLLSLRKDKQAEGTFDEWYKGMDESTRQYFDQRIEEEQELAEHAKSSPKK